MSYPDNHSADSVAADQLRAFVERIERMHEERKAIADDISDIFKEAKANGFDVTVLREVIRIRSKDPSALAEHHALLDLYLNALGSHVRAREEDA